jgi:hypothetical protein
MLRRALVVRALFLLGLCLASFARPVRAETATVPNVAFVVLRLDYLTYTVKGGYTFSHPFRKVVLPESFTRVGDVDYYTQPAIDFGYSEIRSRLTGQLVVRASTVWAGAGHWEQPSTALLPMALGGTAADPSSRIVLWGNTLRADTAWASARQAQALEPLAATGNYEVVMFRHYYTVGVTDPNTAEWVVIAFTRPPAPPDVGVTHVAWPYGVVPTGVATVGEATVTNFSDDTQSLWLQLRIDRLGTPVYTSTMPVGSLAADASRVITLDPYIPDAPGTLTFAFSLVSPPGTPWTDTFADNDVLAPAIEAVNDAVFRPVASLSRPGPIPTQCYPVDFDGDGDLDLVQYAYQPKLLRRNSSGTYDDVTGLTPVALQPYPRFAVAEDFDRDGHPDLLLVTFDQPLMLLHGDGTGAFSDMTAAAGLSGVNGSLMVAVLDLEGDGDPDLIAQSYGQDPVLANDGHGHFSNVTAASGLVAPEMTLDLAVGDVNGDGHPDVFVTNWGSPSRLFVNDGDGTFTLAPGPWPQTYGRQVLFLDADGDGRQDIMFLYDSQWWLYRNLGGLAFTDVTSAWGNNRQAFGGAAADLNGDGLPEVLLTSINGYSLLSSQGNAFVDRTSRLANVDGAYALSYEAPQFVDLNEDGLLDVDQMSAVYLNAGGSLDPPASVGPSPAPGSVATFPNPFSPALRPVTVRFAMAVAGPVRVSIWDVRGRRVRTLLDGVVGAGSRSLTWDGRDDAGRAVASGIYFCTIEANGNHSKSRLALLR